MLKLKPLSVFFAATVLVFSMGIFAHETGKQTPAEAEFTYRDSLFHVIGWKIGIMAAIAKGEREQDAALFAKSAREIAMLAPMIPEGFTINTIVEGSLAKPEIWEDFDDFVEKSENLEAAALKIADAADKDLKQAMGMLREFGGSCGGCHRKYKVDTD